MTDTLITEVQQGIIDQIVSSALDVIIWDYLNNPDNGFMVQEEIETITVDASCTVVFFPDTSTTDCIFLDSTTVTWIDTTSSLTVEEWKDIYLEGTYNDAMKTQEKIAFLDSNSPNYPLTDYEHILFNFDTEDSLNYPMSPDTTGDIYIEYTYPTAVKIDGMFFQGGEDGAQFYGGDSNASVILAGYISYSKNGEDWEYLKNEANMVAGDTVAIAATDADDAASSPFIFDDSTGFINSEITNIVFDEVALEAQYWRFHIVDIEAYLTAI